MLLFARRENLLGKNLVVTHGNGIGIWHVSYFFCLHYTISYDFLQCKVMATYNHPLPSLRICFGRQARLCPAGPTTLQRRASFRPVKFCVRNIRSPGRRRKELRYWKNLVLLRIRERSFSPLPSGEGPGGMEFVSGEGSFASPPNEV